MRTIEIGGMSIDISASPLTGLYYEQEFGSGILIDLERCRFDVDRYVLLKCAWAMGKTAKYPSPFPSFEQWAAMLSDIDFSDALVFNPIVAEINRGFFRVAPTPDGDGGDIEAGKPADCVDSGGGEDGEH
jgi:hypothetical protein